MTDLLRVTTTWTGTGVVGGGLTQLFFLDVGAGSEATWVAAFWDAIRDRIPNNCTLTVDGTADVIVAETGVLTGTASVGTTTNLTGTDAGAFGVGVGARIRWETGAVVNGHRVVGTTFVVPMGTTAFSGDGYITDPVATDFQTAGAALITASSGNLVVWTRPKGGAGSGVSHVSACSVPREPSWLRSRKT